MKPIIGFKYRAGWALAALTVLGARIACAATLSAGSVAWAPPASPIVPIALSSTANQPVASLQFDLNFNATVFSVAAVTIGPAASAADKSLTWNAIEPGRVRVLVTGLNQTAIEDGIIAYAEFDVDSATDGAYPITFSGVVAAKPTGTAVTTTTAPGEITIVGSSPASLKVKTPNGGETWTLAGRNRVKWNSTGAVGTSIRIELWHNGSKVRNLKGNTLNDGRQKIRLKTTDPVGGGNMIRIVSLANPTVNDRSNSGFNIVAAKSEPLVDALVDAVHR